MHFCLLLLFPFLYLFGSYGASTNVFQMESFVATESAEIEYKRGNKKLFYHALRSAFSSSEIEGLAAWT